jgi:hypothetical protein
MSSGYFCRISIGSPIIARSTDSGNNSPFRGASRPSAPRAKEHVPTEIRNVAATDLKFIAVLPVKKTSHCPSLHVRSRAGQGESRKRGDALLGEIASLLHFVIAST